MSASGDAHPNLDQATLLVLGVANGDSFQEPLEQGWRASLYAQAGEATVCYVSRGQGHQFRIVTEDETGERLRSWERDRREHQDRAQEVGLKAAQREGQISEADEAAARERQYWRDRGYVVAEPATRPVCVTCSKCASCAPGRVERSERKENDRARVVADRRASGKVRRFARAWRLDHLWTLTYRGGGERDGKKLLRDLRGFLREFAELVGRRPMVIVREPHPLGHGWHLHFAISGWVSVRLIRECWPHGSVNVKGPRKGSSPRKLAGYLAKYVSKGMSDEHCEASGVIPRRPGEHRYYVTQGYALVPVVVGSVQKSAVFAWLVEQAGEPVYVWSSGEVPDWQGPPCYWFDLQGHGLDAPTVSAVGKVHG